MDTQDLKGEAVLPGLQFRAEVCGEHQVTRKWPIPARRIGGER